MGTCYDGADAVGQRTHHHSGFARHRQTVDLVAGVVGFAEEGVGDGDELVGASADIDAVDLIVNTHHGIVGGIDTDALATGVATTGKEFLIHLLADDTHLACLSDVHLVDVAPVVHHGRCHPGIVVVHAGDSGIEGVLSHHGFLVAAKHIGRDDVEFGHLLAQARHVFLHHHHIAALAESLVGFGGVLCPYHGGIGGKTCEVRLQHLLQSLSAAYKDDEHEHTPEHTEACEEATALVAGDGVENLAIGIYIKFHGNEYVLSE